MSDLTDPSTPSSTPTPRTGWPLLAWLVIVGLSAFLVWRNTEQPAGGGASAQVVTMQAQARYLVGVSSLAVPGASKAEMYGQAKRTLADGSHAQRLRFAVLAGELAGPAEALDRLAILDREEKAGKVEERASEKGLSKLLQRLYRAFDQQGENPLTADEQDTLRQNLGWFGDLALAPEGSDDALRQRALAPARRTAITYLVVASFAFIGAGVGGMLLLALLIQFFLGRLSGGLDPGSGHGGIYAETFALYMLLYLGMGALLRFLPRTEHMLALNGLVMLLSLVALVWPLLRGVPWSDLRRDLGLHLGERPAVEGACGVGTYVCAVPVLIVGVLIMLGLMHLRQRLVPGAEPFRGGGGPSHPIVGIVRDGRAWLWIQVFLVAGVIAPIVEEILFRGVLYRHLRDATSGRGRVVSVTLSILVSAFVFAVIHPQGWMGVPPLMGLASVFALAREWRQSLVAPILAHGINNTLITLLLLATTA